MSRQTSSPISKRDKRLSPTIIKERLERIEVLTASPSLSHSTISDRLEIVDEYPEDWQQGIPKPWYSRSPLYDKPLPTPMRTPSPMMPSISPQGRREQERTASTPSRIASRTPTQIVLPGSPYLDVDLQEEWRQVAKPRLKVSEERSERVSPFSLTEQILDAAETKPIITMPVYEYMLLSADDAEESMSPKEHGRRSVRQSTPMGFLDALEAETFEKEKPKKTLAEGLFQSGSSSVEENKTDARKSGKQPSDRDKQNNGKVVQGRKKSSPAQASSGSKVDMENRSSPQTNNDDRRKLSPLAFAAESAATQLSPERTMSQVHSPQSGPTPPRNHKQIHSGQRASLKAVPKVAPLPHLQQKRLSSSPTISEKMSMAELGESSFSKSRPTLSKSASTQKPSMPPKAILTKQSAKDKNQKIANEPTAHELPAPAYKTSVASPRARVYRKGRLDDWRSPRRYPVYHYFNPKLFHRLHQTIYSPGDWLRHDWKVQRVHFPEHYFVPARLHHTERDQHIYEPGEWLRHDWKVSRRHFPEHFLNPALFENRDPISLFDWYRMDWKVNRKYPSEKFFEASLFDKVEDNTYAPRSKWREAECSDKEFMSPISSRSKSPFISKASPSIDAPVRAASPKSPLIRQYEQGQMLRSMAEEPRLDGGRLRVASPKGPLIRGFPESRSNQLSPSIDRVIKSDDRATNAPIRVASPKSPLVKKYLDEPMKAGKRTEQVSRTATRTLQQIRIASPKTPLINRFDLEQHLASSSTLQRKKTASPHSPLIRPFGSVSPQSWSQTQWRMPSGDAHEGVNEWLASGSPALHHKRGSGSSPQWTTKRAKSRPTAPDSTDLWDQLTEWGPSAVDHEALVEEFMMNGVPRDMNYSVWISLLGLPMMSALSDLYPDLLASAKNPSMQYDVHRAVEDEEDRQALMRILTAYGQYDPVVGYAPGHLHMAMTLLSELTEEQAFAGLTRLAFAWDHRRMVVPGVDGLRESLYVFDELMKELLPRLHEYLGQQGISSELYAASWFQAMAIHPELDHDMMTWFLLDGRPALFSVALGLMALNEQRLLEQEYDKIMYTLNHDLVDRAPLYVLNFAREYYPVSHDKILHLQSEFLAQQRHSLQAFHDEEIGFAQREARHLIKLLARVSESTYKLLDERDRLLKGRCVGLEQVDDLQRLSYEQAYRLHIEDARIVDDQFYHQIADDDMPEDDSDTAVEQGRIAGELADVKVKYAEALAELDELKSYSASNQKPKGRAL